MKHTTSFTLIILLISLFTALFIVTPVSPQTLPTVTPFPMRSLFTQDTCVPPCWFGLIPGESTAQDAEIFLSSYSADKVIAAHISTDRESVFDSETGYMVNGEYYFRWDETVFEREESFPLVNVIRIRQGLVDYISVQPMREVLLGEALSILGPPDHIIAGGGMSPYIRLIYTSPRVVVELDGQRFQCDVSRLVRDFTVYHIDYHSPRYGVAFFPSAGERFVSQDTWQAWLRGEAEGNCWDVWQQLPEKTATPIPLPTVTITFTPVSPQALPTATPFPMRSLFEQDTCTPPCWFGLTPGQSTVKDAQSFLNASSANKLVAFVEPDVRSIFNSETGDMVQGWYYFQWDEAVFERKDVLPSTDAIGIWQGLVDYISVQPMREILLGEALSILGPPDLIIAEGVMEPEMKLIYVTPRLEIILLGSRFQCDMSRIAQDFEVYDINYESSDYDVDYSVSNPSHRGFIPQNIWQAWLRGEVEGNCWDVWQQWLESTETPAPLPTLNATITPSGSY